ncbi:glucoamylase family protein [Persicirhabdus sediminis]|uniref:Beta-glucosidase n=1 Tax=Persicirhabdus sediminis TaxID=454144 RepID=A0A8J7SH94_9BACT|nr:glucoamylase family protein [Persicirhabdus sediminis]MBK1789701.1 beta-glucosidase [Persicirhabdus sediminis]
MINSLAAEKNIAQHDIENLRALPRMLRVDLVWQVQGDFERYEVQRAESKDGEFTTLENPLPMVNAYSDYIGEAGKKYFYRVRKIQTGEHKEDFVAMEGNWSPIVSATTTEFEREGFLTEVQEAGFRYYYDYSNPVSGLPREGIKPEESWDPEFMSAVSTGIYFFNIAVGIERGFITREEGVNHVTKVLNFLHDKSERHLGAFSHWIDGYTGKTHPFSDEDDGADMVETAIIAQGLIFAREYFDKNGASEEHIRMVADKLWRDIQWDKFIRNPGTENVMMWHWSPTHGFSNLRITGFNESEIAYILGVGSPTYPTSVDTYWDGWVGGNKKYFKPREVEGLDGPIPLVLTHGYGIPMFVMHYSYLGLDPKQVPLGDGFLFEEFERLTLANHDYCRLNADKFKGYDKYWGLTASLDPDGYLAHEPDHHDNGTISPTGALSSIAYQPELVIEMMERMYLEDGKELWGPFGFYDAFNPSRNWIAKAYIGIDVGPIGPMIENYRTGKLWEAFMKAEEINDAIEKIWSSPKAIKP